MIGERKTRPLSVPVTTFSRTELDYSWYNVLNAEWVESTTDDGAALNNRIAQTSVEPGDANAGRGGRGPIAGNGQIVVQVEADSSTTGLEVDVGSFSYSTLGDVSTVYKGKGAEKVGLAVTQTGSWEPLFALRADPGRPNVSLQLKDLEITAGEGKALAILCDPSNVLKPDGSGGTTTLVDSDFDPPEEHSRANSVVEVTDGSTVTQIPDNTGSPGTTVADPGGYQGMFATSRTSGTGSKTRSETAGPDDKHGVLDGDYLVFIAKPSASDTGYAISYPTEQDW